MKPYDLAITRNYPICRAQRLPRKEHLCGFQTPALLVLGVDVLVPENWIFQPLLSRISKCSFDLRAHIRFADTSVEISHKYDRRYLLQKSTVFSLKIWYVSVRGRPFSGFG